jgi:predicted nucleic acid-binding Zn ribbon protein
MGTVKETQMYKEKRKIKRTFLLVLLLFVILVAVLGSVFGWSVGLYSLGVIVPAMGILTIIFIISYKHSAKWGWLLFGRRRMHYGSPWESRISRELASRDARMIAEEQMKYESTLYHQKAEELLDARMAKKKVRKMRERQKLDVKPKGKKKYGKDVLFCPQCETPFVFDTTNKSCVVCSTKLHDGKNLLFEPKKEKPSG